MKKQVELILMHRIVNELDRRTATIARQHGLTLLQFAVLEVLYHKGDLSIGEVKDSVLSSDGTIPVVVRNLVQQGLIASHADARDKRRTIISLTPKGRDTIATLYPENEAMLEEAFQHWTETDRKTLRQLLLKMDLL